MILDVGLFTWFRDVIKTQFSYSLWLQSARQHEMDVKKKIAAFIGEFDLQMDQVENILLIPLEAGLILSKIDELLQN